MKKLKKSIIIITILIILILILLILINIQKGKEESMITQTEDEIEQTDAKEENLQIVKDKREYLNVRNSLNQYISAINQNNTSYYGYDDNNNYTIIVDQKTINTNIYNVLSESYIKKNSIDISNVKKFVYEIKEECFYIPIEIYKKTENQNIKTYAIYGVIESLSFKPIKESYLILNIDEQNNTFSAEQLKNKEELSNIQVENINSIEEKENNVYQEAGKIDEDIIKDYVTTYKRLALAYPKIAYDKYLDEEYKQKKFGKYEEFEKYINERKSQIESINIKKYNYTEQENYLQYIAVDQNEKYYIFKVNSIIDYKILLDNYTVDTPQFLEKYNAATTMEKVGYNIQKCLDAINDKDYSYMYSKLDNEFKNNYYKTENSFKDSIKEKLFEKNKVSEVSSSNEGNTYIYNLVIEDMNNNNNKRKLTVIMKLGAGTDYIMSFSFK